MRRALVLKPLLIILFVVNNEGWIEIVIYRSCNVGKQNKQAVLTDVRYYDENPTATPGGL